MTKNEVTTEYIPSTSTTGANIIARCDGYKFEQPWDRRMTLKENHIRVARYLFEDFELTKVIYAGGSSRCKVQSGAFTSEPISHLKCEHILV